MVLEAAGSRRLAYSDSPVLAGLSGVPAAIMEGSKTKWMEQMIANVSVFDSKPGPRGLYQASSSTGLCFWHQGRVWSLVEDHCSVGTHRPAAEGYLIFKCYTACKFHHYKGRLFTVLL